MSKFGEFLARHLNKAFPKLPMQAELEKAKRDLEANQRWAYREAERVIPFFGSDWNLAGKLTLDVGTGLGGKIPFWVNESQVKRLVSIDIDEEKLVRYQNQKANLQPPLLHPDRVYIAACDAAALPFPDNCFDALVSINTFEHIHKLDQALESCFRILKPGGHAYLQFPPYYSPWGPHLGNWIHYPWPHVLFSEKTLLNVLASVEKEKKLNREFLPATQIDWEKPRTNLPNLNRVTLRGFRRLIKKSGFLPRKISYLPFGYERLKTSFFRRLVYYLLKGCTHLPFLQEIVVTKMVFILEKPREERKDS